MATDPIRLDPVGPQGPVPTLLFVPEQRPAQMPLVLLGHGAHLSKDDPIMQMLCRAFEALPATVAIIDCPAHGERRDLTLSEAAWEADVLARVGQPAVHAQLVGEWTAVIAAARAAVPEASGPVAYAGFSMGTMFGLSIVGDLPDVAAAVFVVGGYIRPDRANARAVNDLIAKGIAKLGDRPVLMCNMSGDESFPIAGAIEVLEAIPGPKQMGVWVGGHTDVPSEAMALAMRWLRRTLRAA